MHAASWNCGKANPGAQHLHRHLRAAGPACRSVPRQPLQQPLQPGPSSPALQQPDLHPQHPQQRRRRRGVVAQSGLDGFVGLSAFLKPEIAAMFSALLAVGSVGLNYYGNLLTESKRVELQKELDREKQAEALLTELASIISRYRGPLLESSVDLEQRLWHLATMTGEWYKADDVLCGEEIAYTLFTLAQFLGFLEVVRREGPRERSFLAAGNPQGSDTLATLVESFRFVLCASPATLQGWLAEPDASRDHPGARQRRPYEPTKGKRKAMTAIPDNLLAPSGTSCSVPLRVSRGSQRAIGSQMGATPLGSERHYTHSYSTFLSKLQAEPDFAAWLQPIEADLAALLTGPSWMGEPLAPLHRWTRVLLMQQLLVDCIDLLDPDYVRVPANRRIRLSPIAYQPLPNVLQYQAALTLLSGPVDTARFSRSFAEGTGSSSGDGEHFQALQNLLHPERVLLAADQVRRAANGRRNGAASATASTARLGGSPGSSPLSTTDDANAAAAAVAAAGAAGGSTANGAAAAAAASGLSQLARPIVPTLQQLPQVGATGVQLLKALSGQQPAPQPQLQQDPSRASIDQGGTAVTADTPLRPPLGSSSNSRKKSK